MWLSIVLINSILVNNLVNNWIKLTGVEFLIGEPPFGFKILSMMVGNTRPVCIGMGTCILEEAFFYRKGYFKEIHPNEDWVSVTTFYPLCFYCMLGTNWNEYGALVSTSYIAINYSKWASSRGYIGADRYLKVGIGRIFNNQFSAEFGFMHYKSCHLDGAYSGVYLNLMASFSSKITRGMLYPPKITVFPMFYDKNGDGVLHPGEEGKISVYVRNEGTGDAIDMQLKLTLLNDNLKGILEFEPLHYIGIVHKQECTKIEIPIYLTKQVFIDSTEFDIIVKYKTVWYESSYQSIGLIIRLGR